VCINCPYFKECVTPSQQKSSQGRTIDRCVYEPSRERNNEQIATRRSEYKKRQAIVEHPFGTIKRQLFIWFALANSETGIYYTMMKTKPKVETEISIIFLCYNLRRVMSILGQEGLKKAFFAFNKRFLSMISTIDALIRNFAFQIYNTPQKLKYF
jgi:hypothetical protein